MNTINFPNLGLTFESVGQGISILGVNLSYYGIFLALAILLALGILLVAANDTGQHPEDYLELAILMIPAGILGARIYYVLFSWESYKRSIGRIFQIWEGGFAFYGALLMALLVIVFFSKSRQLWTAEVLDTVVPGVLAGQVVASLGNFFNRECLGEYTDSLFAMQLPIDLLRITDVTDKMRNHMVELDGIRYVQVHPLFLYQMIWYLLLFGCLFWYQRRKEYDGEVFWLYVAGDSLGRIVLESLRTDALRIPGMNVPVSRVLACIFFVIAIGFLIYNRKMDGRGRMRRNRQKNAMLELHEMDRFGR